MNATDWDQWGCYDRMNMEDDADLYQYEIDTDLNQECCSGCMDCLGLSWRDFM